MMLLELRTGLKPGESFWTFYAHEFLRLLLLLPLVWTHVACKLLPAALWQRQSTQTTRSCRPAQSQSDVTRFAEVEERVGDPTLTQRACGLSSCPRGPRRQWRGATAELLSTSFLWCEIKQTMRAFVPKLMSSRGFQKGPVTFHTGDMSTTASPTLPSSQLTSDQLTVVAASCK